MILSPDLQGTQESIHPDLVLEELYKENPIKKRL
jgi:hypothetical protein